MAERHAPDLDAALKTARPGFMGAKQPAPPGADSRPLLVFMESPAYAVVLSETTSMSVIWSQKLVEARMAIRQSTVCGAVVLSPMGRSGEAAKLVKDLRKADPGALVIYHGWDYRPEVSGPRALACGADALVVGGLDLNDMVRLVLTVHGRKLSGQLAPPSQETYEALLEELCPKSPFRQAAEHMRQSGVPPNPTE